MWIRSVLCESAHRVMQVGRVRTSGIAMVLVVEVRTLSSISTSWMRSIRAVESLNWLINISKYLE